MTDLQIIANDSRAIFWDTGNIDSLSREAITERILKYGTWAEVQRLINTLNTDFPKTVIPLVERERSIFTPKEKNFIRQLISHAYRNT